MHSYASGLKAWVCMLHLSYLLPEMSVIDHGSLKWVLNKICKLVKKS